MTIETFGSSGGTATNAGVFIPVADLPGVTASELSGGTAAQQIANAVFGIVKQIYNTISPSSFAALGITVANSEAKPSVGITTRTYSLTGQYIADIDAQSVGPVPVPGSGTNSGVGKFAITDVFPSAALVAAAGSISGAGIVVETAPLVNYGSPAQGSLNPASGQDNRNWLLALYNWFVDGGLTVRVSGTTQSAITTASRSTPVNSQLPTNATASSNPTTGVNAAALNRIFVSSVTYTIAVETIDDQTTDTFSVNVA